MEKEQVIDKEEEYPGYPVYPQGEDIYSNLVKEDDINPDSVSDRTLPNLSGEQIDKNTTDYDMEEADLDVPGSELDDEQEDIGSEDEENNYYSLGDNDYENLDEDNEGM